MDYAHSTALQLPTFTILASSSAATVHAEHADMYVGTNEDVCMLIHTDWHSQLQC